MKIFTKGIFIVVLLLMATNYVQACELPAHPSAAAMPVGITLKGETREQKIRDCSAVKLVQGKDDGQFYYLIPEGSKVKLKIVWDPVTHNNPEPNSKSFELKKEEYDYIKDGADGKSYPPDEEVGKVGGFHFFPLETMAKFFTLSGNRKDVKEAFTREVGVENHKETQSDGGLGPESAFSVFASKGQGLAFTILSNRDKNYNSNPTVPPTGINEERDSIDGLNRLLPGRHWNLRVADDNGGSLEVYLLKGGKLELQKNQNNEATFNAHKVNDGLDELVLYTNSGILMQDMKFDLSQPNPKDYKAYIFKEDGDSRDKIHVEGIGYDKDAPDAANGGSDGYFYATFTTPSIGGDKVASNEDDAMIKVMVNSPPAGYVVTNIFWVWEEQKYTRIKTGKYKKYVATADSDDKESDDSEDKDKEGEDEGEEIDCETVYAYKKDGEVKKCSAEVKIIISKPQDGVGFAAYKIYDNYGPVTSNLVVENLEPSSTDSAVFFEKDGSSETKSTFKFTIKAVDSNPYFAKEIKLSDKGETIKSSGKPERDISQNLGKMDLTFYYNYPIYDYSKVVINSTDDFNGVGLVELADDNKSGSEPKFKSYKHKTKWVWKKSKVKPEDMTLVDSESIKGDDGRLIGSEVTITGKVVIDEPKPWHEANEDNDGKFCMFAVFKDTAGNTHLPNEFFENKVVKNSSANPENHMSIKYAVNPLKDTGIKLGANVSGSGDSDEKKSPYWDEDLYKQASFKPSDSAWQNKEGLYVKDETGPEIQVVVLDTRTNRYHVFGTSENVAAGFNNFIDRKNDNSYAGISVPYINKNGAIAKSYVYDKFDGIKELFNKYYQGPNAVSTIFENTNKNGFVCGKNTRLVFYIHAFDNIGYTELNQGISSCQVILYENGKKFITISDAKSGTILENVFRKETDNGANSYLLKVLAKDKLGKDREFDLNIAVTGRTLDIRTLEEKRERIN